MTLTAKKLDTRAQKNDYPTMDWFKVLSIPAGLPLGCRILVALHQYVCLKTATLTLTEEVPLRLKNALHEARQIDQPNTARRSDEANQLCRLFGLTCLAAPIVTYLTPQSTIQSSMMLHESRLTLTPRCQRHVYITTVAGLLPQGTSPLYRTSWEPKVIGASRLSLSPPSSSDLSLSLSPYVSSPEYG